MSISGSDTVDLQAWVNDLTYQEVHAFLLGIAVAVHLATTGQMQLVADMFGVIVAGNRGRKGAKFIRSELDGKPAYVKKQIKQEGWYLTAGFAAAYIVMMAPRYI